jgi:hypothetical protein
MSAADSQGVSVKEDSDQNSTDLMKCMDEVEALEDISGKTVSLSPCLVWS